MQGEDVFDSATASDEPSATHLGVSLSLEDLDDPAAALEASLSDEGSGPPLPAWLASATVLSVLGRFRREWASLRAVHRRRLATAGPLRLPLRLALSRLQLMGSNSQQTQHKLSRPEKQSRALVEVDFEVRSTEN